MAGPGHIPLCNGAETDAPDDRCPYAVVEAVFHTVARLCLDIADENAAWEAFVERGAADERRYFEAIRRSRHSVFLYQQQQLYEFGTGLTESGSPGEFCLECGRQFMRMFSVSNVGAFLRMAFSGRGSLRSKIVDMVRTHLGRYAGTHYVLTDEVTTKGISLTLESSRPDDMKAYYERHGLDADACFANSFYFIAGALDKVFSALVAGYDPASASFSVSGQEGRMSFPVRGKDLLTRKALTQAVMGYVNRLVRDREEGADEEEPELDLVTGSAAMRKTWEMIRRASRTDELVLLRGESGTGKSFLARKMHELSERSDRPFVEVGLTSDIGSDNMIQSDLFGHEKGAFTGALEHKQGLFSLADGGTIFLDEVGDASAELQAKLLRAIEAQTFKRLGGVRDIKVDVRIIAATNRDLERMVKEGSFREDLYYRLNVITIHLPPLRERTEDIPELAGLLFERATSRHGAGTEDSRKKFAPSLVPFLEAYPWPGNIRELDHALKHAAAMAEGNEITEADMPGPVREYVAARGRGETAGPAEPVAAGKAKGKAIDRGIDKVIDKVIDVEALREAIRSSDPVAAGKSARPHELPAHFAYAKRTYLETLIDEFGGDLSLIARYWDRSSEKTIRKLIRDCGLEETLKAAREKARGSG